MKNIWITGASSGIGKALALKFAKEGWHVAASARRENLLSEISNLNKNISSFPLNVTNKENCKSVFEEIKNKYQNIDICFFSTGIWDPKKEKDIDIEQMENVMKVNFFGTLNCIKAVENYFREHLKLRSTPLFLELREGDNPYKDKPNILTGRQKKKRKRMIKRTKK